MTPAAQCALSLAAGFVLGGAVIGGWVWVDLNAEIDRLRDVIAEMKNATRANTLRVIERGIGRVS